MTGNATAGAPLGTVTFYACGPSVTSCSSAGTPVGSPVDVVAGAGNASKATSASFTPSATGTWCFAAYYSGQDNYAASSDTGSDECFSVNPAEVTLASTAGNVILGQAASDAVVANGNAAGGNPTGTVTFYQCGPGVTSCNFTTGHLVGSAVGLTPGAGTTSTATSGSFTPSATGTWCFAAYYSGEPGTYVPSADTSADGCFHVSSFASTVTDAPEVTGSIGLGQLNADSAAVTGNATAGSPTGTFTFYVCGPSLTPPPCTSTTGTMVGTGPVSVIAAAGDAATADSPAFTPSSTGTWCFAAYYSGDSNYAPGSDTGSDGCFTVGLATPAVVTHPTKSIITSGASDTDVVVVTGDTTGGPPSGSVTFYECGPTPAAASCTSATGTELGTGAVTLNEKTATNSGSATSAAFTPTTVGWWCFAGYYSGDSNYTPGADTSTDECVHVTLITPGMKGKPLKKVVTPGTTNTETVKVTGTPLGGTVTGTVTFYVCGPTAGPLGCTSQGTEVGVAPVTLTAGRKSASATSAGFSADTPGTWCFAASYSGGGNYAAAVRHEHRRVLLGQRHGREGEIHTGDGDHRARCHRYRRRHREGNQEGRGSHGHRLLLCLRAHRRPRGLHGAVRRGGDPGDRHPPPPRRLHGVVRFVHSQLQRHLVLRRLLLGRYPLRGGAPMPPRMNASR